MDWEAGVIWIDGCIALALKHEHEHEQPKNLSKFGRLLEDPRSSSWRGGGSYWIVFLGGDKLTSDQSSYRPEGEWEVVDQLHPHVHVEPCRRVGEEAVGVGGDVEVADGGDEGWFEVSWVEGAEVDAYKRKKRVGQLVCRLES